MQVLLGWIFVVFGATGLGFWIVDVGLRIAEARAAVPRRSLAGDDVLPVCLEWVPAAMLLASGIYILHI
jgi:hypothetical protein